ncbi:MAG: hypothetical protein C4518_09570 [Desulfobacteraceae bacterium]|nr:MAG: hypothetical protein C4518_09570 [Desulfobacteraceae bacterium]
MAKGLSLCHQDKAFAGESAGFGLPVLKTADNQTIFPSLVSSKVLTPGTFEAVYHLNLITAWQIFGVPAPSYFRDFMEKIVSLYMNRPGFQQPGLQIRNAIFKLFHIRSTMKPGKSFGYCRVLYQTEGLRLEINVKGEALPDGGQLILLNEVPGTDFSRMIMRTASGRDIRDGSDFLPWQACTIDTAIENPDLHIGFFLSIPDNPDSPSVQIAAGREVGRDLNWAGLALETDQTAVTYHVNFYNQNPM